MKLVFVGGFFPSQIKSEIERHSSGVIQYAADILQRNYIQGLNNFFDVSILNLPFIGSYPTHYKKIFIRSFSFSINDMAYGLNKGFINLPLIKIFSRYIVAKKSLMKLLNSENTLIMIYSVHSPFVQAALNAKTKLPNVKICLVIPDLPKYMSDNKNIFYTLLKKIDSYLFENALDKIDAFVVLSKYMVEDLNISNKPWVCIEGIYNPLEKIIFERKELKKTILYTGTLAKRYGIMYLLEAFSKIENQDYQLWICGTGDCVDEIKNQQILDNRITYFGQLPREDVLKLQKKATVLVNPRTSNGEYTKFSFPSKMMEYLASGTPTIVHRLKGIPEEYFQYCYVAEEETVDSLKNTIKYVCGKKQLKLDEFGRKASKFILENKNPQSQVKKISDLLNSELINIKKEDHE